MLPSPATNIYSVPPYPMPANAEQFDLIVVGGGPAGSTAAAFVAMRGHRVLLLEEQKFPRYSIGESLLPATIHGVCRMLGVREKIEKANFMRKYGGTWRWGREQALWSFFFSENEDLHLQNFNYAYQVERSRFDEILLRHAAETGVDVREQHRVISVISESERIRGVRYVDAQGFEHVATARFVVDASGWKSRLFHFAGERVFSKFFRNVALFGYYENAKRRPAPRQGDILCAAFDAGWFWFIPLNKTLTSVGAVIAPEHSAILQGDHETAMRDFIARCPTIADLLESATRVSEGVYGKLRVRSDYSYCNTRFFARGLVLTGDAACFVDPVFSTGVHLATYSALLAARSINACLGGEIEEMSCFEEFEYRYRIEFQNIYEFLLVIYDMNHNKESYFWNARKILNTDETANEAFVRLVAGMGTTGDEFFERRIGAGEWMDTAFKKHFYTEPPRRPLESTATAVVNARFNKLQEDFGNKRRGAFDESQSMTFGVPFPRVPVRPNGLIASEDGLSWCEPDLNDPPR